MMNNAKASDTNMEQAISNASFAIMFLKSKPITKTPLNQSPLFSTSTHLVRQPQAHAEYEVFA